MTHTSNYGQSVKSRLLNLAKKENIPYQQVSDRFGASVRRPKNDFLTERIAEHFQTADNSLYHNPLPTISKRRPERYAELL